MQRARDHGDREAFAEVVEACHHLLRAVILRETADCDLADEIAQESLARAWTHREQYRSGTSPRAWLLAIARSQLMEFHRRANRDRRHLGDLIRQELMRHRQTEESDENLRLQRLNALKICLTELPPAQRELLDLVHEKGMSTEDAAAMIGIQPAACRQRLSRLQRALRACTEKRVAESSS